MRSRCHPARRAETESQETGRKERPSHQESRDYDQESWDYDHKESYDHKKSCAEKEVAAIKRRFNI